MLLRTIVLVLCLPIVAAAQQSGGGIGAFVGSAVGLAGKVWKDDQYAATGGLGFTVEGETSLHLHADYLIHSAEAPQKLRFFRDIGGDGLFLAYYGAGTRVLLFGANRVGVRGVVGLEWASGHAPWDAFLEVAPVLDVLPDSDWDVTAFFGLRYYIDGRLAERQRPTPVF